MQGFVLSTNDRRRKLYLIALFVRALEMNRDMVEAYYHIVPLYSLRRRDSALPPLSGVYSVNLLEHTLATTVLSDGSKSQDQGYARSIASDS
jgi:hypothetical protein